MHEFTYKEFLISESSLITPVLGWEGLGRAAAGGFCGLFGVLTFLLALFVACKDPG